MMQQPETSGAERSEPTAPGARAEALERDASGLTAVARPGARVDPAAFRRDVIDHIRYTTVKHPREAGPDDVYRAMAHSVRDRLVHRWLATQRTYDDGDVKRVHYLSSEYLTGRSLGLCLTNLDLYAAAEAIAAEWKFDLPSVLEREGDPGLGNGGLGRLAACFMDSLATLQLPAVGYGIRYEYGIFSQSIEHGRQVENHDDWLRTGNAWEIPRHDHTQTVRLYGEVSARHDASGRVMFDWSGGRTVVGLPYDSFIVGHETDTVNTLRLWSARASREFDLKLFNEGDFRRAVEEKVEIENISKVLYPDDRTLEGKELRLKQQYFFVACSIADILSHFKRKHTDLGLLPDRVAVQLNDTHPAVAVAELMRVLVDQEGLDWEPAWDITQRCIAYTNHTLLPEALEKWPVPMFERMLPRHLMIIYEINRRFLRQVITRWPGDFARVERMSLIEEGPTKYVRMAHLAVVGSHSVNGVARMHTDLVKHELLPDFYELYPDRFNNKTNGVSPRRWLLYSNPSLTRLLVERLGPEWLDHELEGLWRLTEQADDEELLARLWNIKQRNKQALVPVVKQLTGVSLDPSSMFVVQIKRIHEYKRQLLACLEVIAHYRYLKRGGAASTPRTYIFAGKAAGGYVMAKLYIRLINDVADLVNGDPTTRDLLRVVFLPNYGVSLAQLIIPAADVSLQISQAGREASGTSNMKLALNGALTVGTLDGANVELREAFGPEHFFLFGQDVDQVKELYRQGYDPRWFIARCPELAEAIDVLCTDFLCTGDAHRYGAIVHSLQRHDPYMVCADFAPYLSVMKDAANVYASPRDWARHVVFNIAGGSRFSSDATIRAYARDIWGIQPVKAELEEETDAYGRVSS
jgi:starch phosphorylase